MIRHILMSPYTRVAEVGALAETAKYPSMLAQSARLQIFATKTSICKYSHTSRLWFFRSCVNRIHQLSIEFKISHLIIYCSWLGILCKWDSFSKFFCNKIFFFPFLIPVDCVALVYSVNLKLKKVYLVSYVVFLWTLKQVVTCNAKI